MLWEMESDPARDKTDHTLAASVATIDTIYQSSSESDSESGCEVYMVGEGDPPLVRPPKKSNERQKRRWHEQPVLPGSSTKGRDIMACKMTLKHWRMSLGMWLRQGDTTQSSTHDAMLTESNFKTGHDRFARKSDGSNTKEGRSTVH
jgi:hypothetical protein